MTPAHRSALEAALESLRSAAFAIEVLISDGFSPNPAAPTSAPAPGRRGNGQRVEVKERHCVICSKPIDRGNRSPAAYKQLRTCSPTCANASRSRTKTGVPRTRRPKPAREPANDQPTPARRPPAAAPKPPRLPRWSANELDILRATYPEGAAAAAKALEAAGSPPRTLATIRTRAQRLGINARPDHPHGDEDERARILTLLNDYRGLPLNREDFIDELHIPRDRARSHLEHLVTTGQILAKPDPSFTGRGRAADLYFPQEANA